MPITHCLSVRNPWASLIVTGLKGIENRTWTTSHRGRIAIHASSHASMIDDYEAFLADPPLIGDEAEASDFAVYLNSQFDPRDPENQIQSAIVGTVEIASIQDAAADGWTVDQLPADSPGYDTSPWCWAYPHASRYLWVLARPVAFEIPIKCHGKLNLWRLGDELERRVAAEHERSSKLVAAR